MSRPGAGNRRSTRAEYIETVGFLFGKDKHTYIHYTKKSRRLLLSRICWLCLLPILTIYQDTGNKISRKAHIEGKPNIMLGGKTVIMAGVTMRGDLQRKVERSAEGGEGSEKTAATAITIGRYITIHSRVTTDADSIAVAQ